MSNRKPSIILQRDSLCILAAEIGLHHYELNNLILSNLMAQLIAIHE